MNPRLARALVRLYPPGWRARYGEEFEAFLVAHPPAIVVLLDVVGWSIHERLCFDAGFAMDRGQRSVVLMAYAYLAAVAAGINFYWTVADTPLAAAMHRHGTLFASWTLVRVGSVLALGATAVAALPVLAMVLRSAWKRRRWDVVGRLAVPPGAALLTVVWMLAAWKSTGGHWVPTPWDVAGDWTAPAEWPPTSTRWALSSVTFLLLAAGFIVSAISIRQAVDRSDVLVPRRFWLSGMSIVLVGSLAAMALGVLAWGWFAQQSAALDFHTRNGGIFTSTNFVSWLTSCVIFLASVVIAFQAARSATLLRND